LVNKEVKLKLEQNVLVCVSNLAAAFAIKLGVAIIQTRLSVSLKRSLWKY